MKTGPGGLLRSSAPGAALARVRLASRPGRPLGAGPGPGPRAAFYIIGSAVVSAGITGSNIIVGSFRQAYCPPAMLGRVSASQRFLIFSTIPLGTLIAGGLGTIVSIRGALWVMLSLDALCGTVLLTRAVRADKNLPEATPRSAEHITSSEAPGNPRRP